jgi:DnaK suppressor protein
LKEADVTAVKKAAPSKPRKAVPPSKATTAAKKAGSKAKGSTATKAILARKKTAVAKKAATKKAATKKAATKKGVPATNASAPARKKSAPAPKKAAVKKSPPAAKKAAANPKAGAPTKKTAVAKKAATAPVQPRRPSVGPYAKEAKFLEEQRELLLEERAIYRGQALDLRAEADSLALEREPGDVQFDEESGEGGTVTVDRERNLALSAQASAAVEEIDDALRKIERKSYGGCERCHQAIPKARLRALPFARLCVACKSGGLSRR